MICTGIILTTDKSTSKGKTSHTKGDNRIGNRGGGSRCGLKERLYRKPSQRRGEGIATDLEGVEPDQGGTGKTQDKRKNRSINESA